MICCCLILNTIILIVRGLAGRRPILRGGVLEVDGQVGKNSGREVQLPVAYKYYMPTRLGAAVDEWMIGVRERCLGRTWFGVEGSTGEIRCTFGNRHSLHAFFFFGLFMLDVGVWGRCTLATYIGML